MLTKSTVYQQIYNTNNSITIHAYTIISEDGKEISRSEPMTATIHPGDDYSNQDTDTQTMCKALWTDEIINAYKATIPSLAPFRDDQGNVITKEEYIILCDKESGVI